MSQALSGIRRVTEDDIDAGIAMVRQCYPARPIEGARDWVRWMLRNPDRLVLIGDHSVGCAQFGWKYGFEPRARLDFIAAAPSATAVMEPLRMIQMMVQWAKSKGAKGGFRLDADTDVDFGPFARRLGGSEGIMRYWDIPLE